MRTLRLALVETVILAMLGGPGAVVLAQDPEQATWTHVTGTAQEEEWVGDEPNDPTHRWDGSIEYIPGSSATYAVEWSDPRLPMAMSLTQDAALHHGDMTSYDDWMWLFATTARLDGPGGAWAGSGHGVIGTDGEKGMLALEGERAYEGMSALLDMTWSEEDDTVLQFDGWLFESALPTMPDPLELATK